MMYEQTPRALDMLYDWSPEKMVEIDLEKPDDFLKVKETLTRIGIVGKRTNEDNKQFLTQTCHLLHKKGRYYVVHFKEMFALDGRDHDLTISDVERRNLIVSLLQDWGLAKILSTNLVNIKAPMASIRVISHKEKNNFVLQAKYQVGARK
jgi:hypothetical protein